MTEQELIEALMDRLFDPRGDMLPAHRIADEILRQMHWAVSQAKLSVDLTTIGRKASATFVPSLAPEGWDPRWPGKHPDDQEQPPES